MGAFVNASDAGSIGDARPCADQRPRLAVAGQDAEDDEGDPDELADTAAHSTAPMTPSATNAVRTHAHDPADPQRGGREGLLRRDARPRRADRLIERMAAEVKRQQHECDCGHDAPRHATRGYSAHDARIPAYAIDSIRTPSHRRAHRHTGQARTFRDPSGRDHLRSSRSARREPVVRRRSQSVVVKAVDWLRAWRASAVQIRSFDIEDQALELPVAIALHFGTFTRVGRVEMRALGTERGAEEPAHRTCRLRCLGVHAERLARSHPA